MVVFLLRIHMTEKEARRYIAELFKTVDTKSILIVIHTGELKRLYCPFWVICKVEVFPLKKGNKYTVEVAKMTLKLEDVFIIEKRAYFVWYFWIKV